jgi:integrase
MDSENFQPVNFLKDGVEENCQGKWHNRPPSFPAPTPSRPGLLRIAPNRLVRLMGSESKKMIYEVYGDYIEGLEEDFWQVPEYYGRDFAEPKKKIIPQMINYHAESAILISGAQIA